MRLKVTVWELRPGVCIIQPQGELVINNHERFEREVRAVLERQPDVLIFDLEKVEYISSIGIQTLLMAYKDQIASQGQLLLVNLQPQVERVLSILNIFPAEQIFSGSENLHHYLNSFQFVS